LLLLSHLGTGRFLDEAGRPVAERYAAAAELLAALHLRTWPLDMPVAPGVVHRLPPFDRDAMMIEVDLLPQWYLPWKTGAPATPEFLDAFAAAWNSAFDWLDRAEKSIVLRDFHSPNIVWRGDRTGLDRLGVLDFQDALYGPAAYDVASLAMDARVTVPEAVQASTVEAYVAARHAAGPFDEATFHEAYAICAAQRNTKILGIFVRLWQRDGKPGYIVHLPRIRAYLRKALMHPALAPVAALYEAHGLLSEGP
jgi:aminoglycoside/choline kinase family phosphotransferase